jgi:hypothetical protein
MGILKKTALALALFVGLAVFAYGETSYDLSVGYYRLGEEFFNDDFGRGQNGMNVSFSLYHFPQTTLLGFLFRTSFGGFISGYEWKGNEETETFDSLSSSDLRIYLAPSYKLNLGSRVDLPLTLGPVFTIYWEENSGSSQVGNDYQSWKTYYEALNLGIIGDITIIITPSDTYKWFFIKQGISFGWDFLHAEKGEMRMAYRHTRNARYNPVPYSSFAFSVFFGVGLQFE